MRCLENSLYTTHILNNEVFTFEPRSTRSCVVIKNNTTNIQLLQTLYGDAYDYACHYGTTLSRNIDTIKEGKKLRTP